ncbi:glycosyltransferase family 4 protein [Agromyces sp. NPDC058484]|uniref:glycosyltransferase family 4 protein n=1 Tax=Agromyces sp. NPDC058484 TaxID=3346524 RepID=UPI00364A5CA1
MPTPELVHVLYRAERDLARWQERHAAGEVPGRWPYGLDGLADCGLSVVAESVGPATTLQTGLSRLVPARVRSMLAGSGIGLTWDEHVAQRMVQVRPFTRMLTGVIWLTDGCRDAGAERRARAVLATMQGLWVNSRAQLEPLREFVGAAGPPVDYFRFGVDAMFFERRPYPERPLVVSVGGDRDRDPETLFAALALLRRARPEVEIVVQSASAVDPPPGVVKVPRLSHVELRALYTRASVVAVATRPNLHVSGLTVSLEAMATGRPVVITESPGMDDYLHDGSTAVFVPSRRPEDLFLGMVRLLDDPAGAEQMGDRGRVAIEQGLTTTHLAQGLARFIRSHAR